STLSHNFTEEGRQAAADAINFRIMLLICCDGLVPNVIDGDRWKDFVQFLCKGGPNHSYKPISSDAMARKIIPNEASLVRKRTLQALDKTRNLTITFDGNSIRKPQSVYTTHITDSNRNTYFWDGHEGTDKHHTADYVQEVIERTIEAVGGPSIVANINSDNTGNVRKARRNYAAKEPTVLNTRDAVHAIHNTIGEINSLPEFKPMLSTTSKVVQFLRKSNISNSIFRKDGKESGDRNRTRGLISMGKTRFATHWSTLNSLEPHLRPIQRLVETGHLEIKGNADVRGFFTDKAQVNDFEITMDQYLTIVGPFARSLWSLESTLANAADVYVFWLAIASTLKDIFASPDMKTRFSIGEDLIHSVIRVVNKRYKDFIDDSPTDIYFSAFYMDPCFSHSAILKSPTTGSTTTAPTIHLHPPSAAGFENDDSHGIIHPKAYDRAKKFLKTILQREVDALDRFGEKALLYDLMKKYMRKDSLVDAFKHQLNAFGCDQYPFRAGRSKDQDPLKWWEHLSRDDSADVLGTIAVKIFAILPNSMPDERTGSNFTWFNSPLRGNQTVGTLVNMIQVGQWYKFHVPRVNKISRR
ncbi:hypothetical protein K435DRAFT_914113, partial [Dendrothele bispora CBS 962.96]